MQITIENVQALNPCRSRFENFTKEYPGFDGSHPMFLSLEKITYSDKVWVMTRLMSHEQNSLWAAACAESVLHLTREQDRGACRAAIDAVRKYINGKITRDELIAVIQGNAADYATDAAVNTAAAAAANTAYAAAANTAYAANATYAVAAAAVAAVDKEKQQQICLDLMMEILNY